MSFGAALTRAERRAIRHFVGRVLAEVPARLAHAALFGSRARGDAGPRSDIDILLIFETLSPDREPHAGIAEAIAEEVAAMTRVPVTVWSVARIDLAAGNRTPMLVDALADALPIWRRAEPLPRLSFTPADALHCARAIEARLGEGRHEFAALLDRGDFIGGARRARDDIVRACTGLLLLRGITRPRRAEAVRCAMEAGPRLARAGSDLDVALRWASRAFGPSGHDEEFAFPPPPLTPRDVAGAIEGLRHLLREGMDAGHFSCTRETPASLAYARRRAPPG